MRSVLVRTAALVAALTVVVFGSLCALADQPLGKMNVKSGNLTWGEGGFATRQ